MVNRLQCGRAECAALEIASVREDEDMAPADNPMVRSDSIPQRRLLAAVRTHAQNGRAVHDIEPLPIRCFEREIATLPRNLYGLASRRMNLPDLRFAALVPAEVDPLPVVRPTRTDFVGDVARYARRLPAIRGHHINVARPARVAVERDLLSVGRPAGAAHRRPVEEGQLRLVRAVAVGNPDLLRASAIADERDALAVRRHTEIALVPVRFDQRTRRGGAITERHLEYLGFDLPRHVDHAAGLPRHARLCGNHGRSRKTRGLAAIARDAPERGVSAAGRTREQ